MGIMSRQIVSTYFCSRLLFYFFLQIFGQIFGRFWGRFWEVFGRFLGGFGGGFGKVFGRFLRGLEGVFLEEKNFIKTYKNLLKPIKTY